MISLENLTEENLIAVSRSLQLNNIAVLERMFHAFILLDRLTETGIDFVFKGGTSVLLHMPNPKRLSVDIDIVCTAEVKDFEKALTDVVCRNPPFLRYEKLNRGAYRQPKRRHYKFFYPTKYSPSTGELFILLDVVEEKCPILNVETRKITIPFMKQIGEDTLVRTPCAEALLADKLTAFAPHTIGVPFRRGKTISETQEHQVFKQLYDIGQFPLDKMNLDIVRENYFSIAEAEASFKADKFTTKEALLDTIGVAFDIACLDLPRKTFTEEPLLRSGIAKLQGDLIHGERFDFRKAKQISAQTACLAAALLTNLEFPFFVQTPEIIEKLRMNRFSSAAGILDKLKRTNIETYWYWYNIKQMLPEWEPVII